MSYGLKNFFEEIFNKYPKLVCFTPRILEAFINKPSFTQREIEYVLMTFNPALTDDFINIFTRHNIYAYNYHSHAHLIDPNSSPPQTYIESYPDFFACVYLAKKRLSELKSQKDFFAKYKKDTGTYTLLPRHIQAIFSNKGAVSKKFMETILTKYNVELSFVDFVYIVKSFVSDRRGKLLDFIAENVTELSPYNSRDPDSD